MEKLHTLLFYFFTLFTEIFTLLANKESFLFENFFQFIYPANMCERVHIKNIFMLIVSIIDFLF
jgi:hypothetical protein